MCLGFMFSEWRMEQFTDRWINLAAAVSITALACFKEEGAQPQHEALNWLVYVVILTCGHDMCIITKKKGPRYNWLK